VSKRPNATGAVYRNKSRGRWEASLIVGHREDGRPIRRTFTGKTRGAVEDKLDEARRALNQGLDIPDPRTTVEDFTAWWSQHVLPAEGLAPATEQWYRDVLGAYVLPHVGARTLTGPKALTPGDVQAMTGQLMAAGRSHRVAEGARTALGKVLRAAEQRGLVGRNVARIAAPWPACSTRTSTNATSVPAGTPWSSSASQPGYGPPSSSACTGQT
jgi:hypothetical protein